MALQTRKRKTEYAALLILSQAFLSFLLLSLDSCIAFTSTGPSNSFSVIESSSSSSSRRLRQDLTVQSLFFGKQSIERTADIPYIVERINRNPNELVFRDIADMCINVFFKEQLNAKPQDRVA